MKSRAVSPWMAMGLLVAATVLWSGNYVAGRYLAQAMPALLLNGLRWTLSAAIFGVLLRVTRTRVPWRKEAPALLTLGLLGMFLFSSLTYMGLRTVPAAQAGMISGVIPVAIVLFGRLILAERPTRQGWLGVGLAVCGVLMLMASRGLGHAVDSLGDLELLVAALAWGAYTALSRRWQDKMDSLALTAGAATFGAVPSLLAGIWASATTPWHMSVGAWLAFLYVGTAASVLAYWLWNRGVMTLGAARSAPFINLLPVFTVLLSVVLLHEKVDVGELIGGALTVAGAVLAGIQRSHAAASTPQSAQRLP